MNPVINRYGTKKWFDSDKKFHREDGPAIEWHDGEKCWYKHGKRHREDGPAVEDAGYKAYWLEDIFYLER